MDNLSTSLTDARENRPAGLYSLHANDLSTILTRELINVTLTRDISSRIGNTIPLIRIDRLLPSLYAFRLFTGIFRILCGVVIYD